MIAVVDTSPVCYLVLIGEVDLLPKIFSRVCLPTAVLAELQAVGAPNDVRVWASQLPAWLTVKAPGASSIAGLERLQCGEREASLASVDADPLAGGDVDPRTWEDLFSPFGTTPCHPTH
jgi:predicted nucleic acid-binding protein